MVISIENNGGEPVLFLWMKDKEKIKLEKY